MTAIEQALGAPSRPRRLRLVPLGLSLSTFAAINFVLCVLLGLFWPEGGLHQPWLQFLPGFTWLTWQSFLLGLVESFAYGWYFALIFTPLFNFFSSKGRLTP